MTKLTPNDVDELMDLTIKTFMKSTRLQREECVKRYEEARARLRELERNEDTAKTSGTDELG